ncbi:hypothetical protein ABT160_45850 [Streptomyces sp. NPDC001941]|uniref:hypothetical protein n=1 Tax=Streptomyces sp. NPDC001941 TaxID=3154659 RepID=UPI0033188F8E
MVDSLRELWLRGLAFNPAAPSDLLIRLLDQGGEIGLEMCQERALPDAVIDAALSHPAVAVRGALARNLHIDPMRLIPLATDRSSLVRAYLARGNDSTLDWGPQMLRRIRPLPDDILIALLTAKEPAEDGILSINDILGELAASRHHTPVFEASLAGREQPELRIRATWHWEKLTPQERVRLLDDPDPAVREAAREHSWTLDPERVEARLSSYRPRNRAFIYRSYALSQALVEQCFADGWEEELTHNPHAPASALARLAHHPDAWIRARIALRPDLEPDLIPVLAADADEKVRLCARLRSFCGTWVEYETLLDATEHGANCTCPFTEPARRPSSDWYAACAASQEPVLRRAAARWPALPGPLVTQLAQDTDEQVRIRLACYHPHAPSQLLLDVFLTRPSHRPHLLTLPHFPTTGLAHLIDDPAPEVRVLAAADPALATPPVHDPDDHVRRAASANPGLPPHILETLLSDPRTAQGAATNPALTTSRMHALLDDCLHAGE